MLNQCFTTALKNGRLQTAYNLYEEFRYRYGEEVVTTKLLTPENIAEILKQTPEKLVHENDNYPSLNRKLLLVLNNKNLSLAGVENYLNEPLISLLAKKNATLLLEQVLQNGYAKDPSTTLNDVKNAFHDLFLNSGDVAVLQRLLTFINEKTFASLSQYHDLSLLHPSKINQLSEWHDKHYPQLCAKFLQQFTDESQSLQHPPSSNKKVTILNQFIFKEHGQPLWVKINRALGRPIAYIVAEKGILELIEMANAAALRPYLRYEEVQELAKSQNPSELKQDLFNILQTRPDLPNDFTNIFGDSLLHALKECRWAMAAYLFSQGAKIPTKAELGTDFLDFIAEHNIIEIQESKRYQFYVNVLKYDPATLSALQNGMTPTLNYCEQVVFPDNYLLEKLAHQITFLQSFPEPKIDELSQCMRTFLVLQNMLPGSLHNPTADIQFMSSDSPEANAANKACFEHFNRLITQQLKVQHAQEIDFKVLAENIDSLSLCINYDATKKDEVKSNAISLLLAAVILLLIKENNTSSYQINLRNVYMRLLQLLPLGDNREQQINSLFLDWLSTLSVRTSDFNPIGIQNVSALLEEALNSNDYYLYRSITSFDSLKRLIHSISEMITAECTLTEPVITAITQFFLHSLMRSERLPLTREQFVEIFSRLMVHCASLNILEDRNTNECAVNAINHLLQQMLTFGLVKRFLDQRSIEAIMNTSLFDYIAQTGAHAILPLMLTAYPAPETTPPQFCWGYQKYKSPQMIEPKLLLCDAKGKEFTPLELQGFVETAFICGNSETGMVLLDKLLANNNPLPFSAQALARVLLEGEYDIATKLINNHRAEVDFSGLNMKEFAPFKGDLIAWLKESSDEKVKELLSCPRLQSSRQSLPVVLA